MTEIIPAILTDDVADLRRLLDVFVAAGVSRVHIDVLDDTLVPGRAFSDTNLFAVLAAYPSLLLDVHLMVSDPVTHMAQWRTASVDRFIVHVEAAVHVSALIEGTRAQHRELWAAINPDTPLEQLTGLQGHPDGVMFMTVQPGRQGSPFLPAALERVRSFSATQNRVPIMVDGGITPETAPQCTAVGATYLACGSYLSHATDVPAALEALAVSVR